MEFLVSAKRHLMVTEIVNVVVEAENKDDALKLADAKVESREVEWSPFGVSDVTAIQIEENGPAEDYIIDLVGLCGWLSAEYPSQLNKRIYSATKCGASLSLYCGQGDDDMIHCGDNDGWADMDAVFDRMVRPTSLAEVMVDMVAVKDMVPYGFSIQTIVEGSDATVDSGVMSFPILKSRVQSWIDEMESEAHFLWVEANGEDEGGEDVD